MQPSLSVLNLAAIQAAKSQDWPTAIKVNLTILDQNPKDIAALNRLGNAYLRQGDKKTAKELFSQVISLDKSNIIAHKQLALLKSKTPLQTTAISANYVIEEPGKAKVIELHRLANKQLLESLAVGQPCQLTPKNRFISIETLNGIYVGALPEDVSFRLAKLIKSGNTYTCHIHAKTGATGSVHIAEKSVVKKNIHVQSFPVKKSSLQNLTTSTTDDFIFENEIPINITNLDHEEGQPDLDETMSDNEE